MEDTAVQDTTLLGFDAGMGALKLYGAPGGLEFVSQVAVQRGKQFTRMVGLRAARPPLQVTTHYGTFYVGPEAHDWGRAVENLDYDRLTGTPEMQALFYGALSEYARRHGNEALTQPLRIIVGLPLEPLAGEEGQDNVKAVKRWLTGTHSWEAEVNGKPLAFTVRVEEVKVTSQPVGALFDYILNEQGQFVPGRKGVLKQEVGVVSIGFNTLELLVVRDRRPVPDLAHGAKVGVRRLLNLADGEGYYTLGQLDAALRRGNLDIGRALPVWEQEIWGVVEEWWGDAWRRFAAVLVVGGGAILLRKSLLRRFGGKAVVLPDPVLSIARGLYKLAVYGQRRKRG